MFGDKQSPGIITLALQDAFQLIKDMYFQRVTVVVSFMEIYNERVKDLLVEVQDDEKNDLNVLEDKNGIVQVPGLTETQV